MVLQHGRAEVLRGLRNFLNMDTPKHHIIYHLKERGVKKGSGRHRTLRGRKRYVFNQTHIGMVLRVTFGDTAEMWSRACGPLRELRYQPEQKISNRELGNPQMKVLASNVDVQGFKSPPDSYQEVKQGILVDTLPNVWRFKMIAGTG